MGNGSIWKNTRRGSDADAHCQSLGFSPRSSYPVAEMTEEEAVFVLGKHLSELRQAGKPMGITRVWVGSSFVSPAELADEYEKHFPPVPKIEPPSEAEIRRARYRALPEDERLAPLPVSETDDSPYARACRSFDALIAAMLAANHGYVADVIAFYRWEFIAPGASPRDQLEAINGVSGGFFGKGEWDRLAEHGGMPYSTLMETMLRLYEYLETLPFGESNLAFIRGHIASFSR